MASKRHDVTVDSLVEELDEARSLALRIDQPAAAVAATSAKAKITGNVITRSESGKPGDFSRAKSPDEVIAQVRNELGERAATALLAALSVAGDREPVETAPDLDAPDLAALDPAGRA